MAPFVLKFKGNKSFSPFSNLSDSDSLTRTWKVCTKIAAHLEQGQRLENLSWRLWHLQSLIVDDNAKSKREFKKLSKNMGERLDKDKGRSIEELQAPEFHRTESSNKLKKRAEEKERSAHIGGRGSGMKAMTFTFPADPTTNKTPGAITTSNNNPSRKQLPARHQHHQKDDYDHEDSNMADNSDKLVIDTAFPNSLLENASTPTSSSVTQSANIPEESQPDYRGHWRSHNASISSISSSIYQPNFNAPPSPTDTSTAPSSAFPRSSASSNFFQPLGDLPSSIPASKDQAASILRFPGLFDSNFEPAALLCPSPSVAATLSYGDSIGFTGFSSSSRHANSFGITRPTFEFPLDELMNTDAGESDADTNDGISGGAWDGKSSVAMTNSVSSLASMSIPTPVSASSMSMASFSNLQIGGLDGGAMQGVVQSTGVLAPGCSPPSFGSSAHQNIDVDLDGDDLAISLSSGKLSPPLVPSRSAPASPAIFAVSSASPSVFTQSTNAASILSPLAMTSTKNDSFLPPLSLPRGALLPGPSPTATPSPPSTSAPAPAPPTTTHRIPRRYSTTNAPPLSSEGGSKRGRQLSATTAPRSVRGLEKSGDKGLPGSGIGGGIAGLGGVKTECANCGANSTPLWRRGLNDELNCNACGLFAKLHKRPRPKTLRTGGGNGASAGGVGVGAAGENGRGTGWANGKGGEGEAGEPVSCYNCATIATPLWRKDEDGRTLCNACGLYLKLHGEKRPSSMKSDVIRKRSRHEVRRGTTTGSSSATPSASPGASRRTSPTPPNTASSTSNNQGQQQQDQFGSGSPQGDSPYDPSNSFDFVSSPTHIGGPSAANGNSSSHTHHHSHNQLQQESAADLMGMNHQLVVDGGVDPSLGGMTFSPGATYTETLSLYPGPLSLQYYHTHYQDQLQQQQQQQQQHHQHHQHHVQQGHQQQQQQQQQTPSSVSSSRLGGSPNLSDGGSVVGAGIYGQNSSESSTSASASGPSSAASSSIWDTAASSFTLGGYSTAFHHQQHQQQHLSHQQHQQQQHHHQMGMQQQQHQQQHPHLQQQQQQQHQHHGHGHSHSSSFGGFGANDAYSPLGNGGGGFGGSGGGNGFDALGFNVHPPMLPFWSMSDAVDFGPAVGVSSNGYGGGKAKMEPNEGLEGFGFGM